MDIAGRTALVTGAGRRVGRAIALALGARGARVAVHYHASRVGAAETVEMIRRAGASGGGEGWAVAADLRRAEAPDELIAAVVGHFGTLDILVNSAAIMVRTPVAEVTPGQWDEIFALNLRAPFFCAQAAARAMSGGGGGRDKGGKGRGGVIVNIADLAGMESWPAYVPHGVSKAAVIHMTRSLARTLAPSIRVNAVAPGAVLLPESWGRDDAERLSRTTPLGRIGSPDDVAGAVLYLIGADYVTGEVLVVDGGRSVR